MKREYPQGKPPKAAKKNIEKGTLDERRLATAQLCGILSGIPGSIYKLREALIELIGRAERAKERYDLTLINEEQKELLRAIEGQARQWLLELEDVSSASDLLADHNAIPPVAAKGDNEEVSLV